MEKNFVRTSSWKANTRHSFKRPAQKKMRHLLKWHICITRVDKLATASFFLSLPLPLASLNCWTSLLASKTFSFYFSILSHAHLLARFVYSAAIDSWRFSHIFPVITFVFVDGRFKEFYVIKHSLKTINLQIKMWLKNYSKIIYLTNDNKLTASWWSN